MSLVNLTDIQVLNNPARFTDPYVFKITFECISELSEGETRRRRSNGDSCITCHKCSPANTVFKLGMCSTRHRMEAYVCRLSWKRSTRPRTRYVYGWPSASRSQQLRIRGGCGEEAVLARLALVIYLSETDSLVDRQLLRPRLVYPTMISLVSQSSC